MTKKDFELIAKTINDLYRIGFTERQVRSVSNLFSDNLRKTNPRFDPQKFYSAATKDLD